MIHTTLVGLEPATFRSLVRRATSSATKPTAKDEYIRTRQLKQKYIDGTKIKRLTAKMSAAAKTVVKCNKSQMSEIIE